MLITKKRGISPLIATILLIGFTIILGAILVTWGMGFVNRIKGETEETMNVQSKCATDVSFDIKNACKSGTSNYTLLLENSGTVDIEGWVIRFYSSEIDASASDVSIKIEKYDLGKLIVTAPDDMEKPDEINEIEVIPKINVEGKEVTCAKNTVSYGDRSGHVLSPCPS